MMLGFAGLFSLAETATEPANNAARAVKRRFMIKIGLVVMMHCNFCPQILFHELIGSSRLYLQIY